MEIWAGINVPAGIAVPIDIQQKQFLEHANPWSSLFVKICMQTQTLTFGVFVDFSLSLELLLRERIKETADAMCLIFIIYSLLKLFIHFP